MQNKVVLVTGAGRGIGRAVAELMGREGAKVVLVSRTFSELKEAARNISKALIHPCDVSEELAVKELFEKIRGTFGPVDCLVNNAAILVRESIEEHSVAQWDQVMAVNLRGPFLCAREFFRQCIREKRGGSIVNVSSLSGVRGTEKFRGFGSYVVSKYGLTGLTDILATEGRALGIRVNAVAPGAVDTQMLRDAAPSLKTEMKPEDIAKSILFLADDNRSPKVSGTVMEIYSNA